MAGFEVDFGIQPELFENFAFGPIAEKALAEAAPVQVQASKQSLERVTKGGEGKMVASIKATKPKKATNGAYITVIRPTGLDTVRSDTGEPRSQPVRNMAKACFLEFGVAGRQPARPWAQAAANNAQAKVNDILERSITEGVNKALGGS